MKKGPLLILTIFATPTLLITAALAGALIRDGAASDGAGQLSALATITPSVHYVEMNGVTLAHREYGRS